MEGRMSVDKSLLDVWDALQRQRRADESAPLPLNGGGGGDNSGGMEARIARLEASMDSVKAELGKLSGVPFDLARMSERVAHMPTRIEVRTDIEAAVDHAAARTQRTVAVVGGIVTVAVAAMNNLPKMLS